MSSPKSRPSRPSMARRQTSLDSPGWYLNAETTPTLEDFAKRTKTFVKRIERFQTICAQNIVMALMRPTPLMLFFFHPIALIIWSLVGLLWYCSSSSALMETAVAAVGQGSANQSVGMEQLSVSVEAARRASVAFALESWEKYTEIL